MAELSKDEVVGLLNRILAQEPGGMTIRPGAYPSIAIGPLLDSHRADISAVLRESLETEGKALALYNGLLAAVKGRSVMLEEYARQTLHVEELHAGEVDEMPRRPGRLPLSNRPTGDECPGLVNAAQREDAA